MSTPTILLAAFAAHLGAVRAVGYSTKSWHSATFSGERHMFEIEVDDARAVDGFAGIIVEADIPLNRGFVADVEVAAILPGPPRRLTVEVLTIDA